MTTDRDAIEAASRAGLLAIRGPRGFLLVDPDPSGRLVRVAGYRGDLSAAAVVEFARDWATLPPLDDFARELWRELQADGAGTGTDLSF